MQNEYFVSSHWEHMNCTYHYTNNKTHEKEEQTVQCYRHMDNKGYYDESAVAKMAATPVEIEKTRAASKRINTNSM